MKKSEREKSRHRRQGAINRKIDLISSFFGERESCSFVLRRENDAAQKERKKERDICAGREQTGKVDNETGLVREN
jgi:hypothetical protein